LQRRKRSVACYVRNRQDLWNLWCVVNVELYLSIYIPSFWDGIL
jgi:hypothetical protein